MTHGAVAAAAHVAHASESGMMAIGQAMPTPTESIQHPLACIGNC